MTRRTLLLTVTLLASGAAAAVYRAAQQPAAPPSLAALVPQGALLTIEAPDFAQLLARWNASPEEKAWLASDNAAVFSNSRLFGRLNDARAEFEAAARTAPNQPFAVNGDFLTQIAGHHSIFAWYDVGNLEFLYLTHLDSAQTQRIALLRSHAGWSTRQSGGITFYLRTNSASADPQAQQSAQGKARTVAYATIPESSGTLLILATREDLIANALQLLHPAAGTVPRVAQETWFADATAALPPAPGVAPDLHMVLNLDRIVPMPYFRSYWVQRNVTEMNQYRAAVSNLYLTLAPHQFMEYRALLPKDPDDVPEQSYLDALNLVPATGVSRAQATHDPADAVTALNEKLLGRYTLTSTPETEAPDPDLDATKSGSVTDLETRIDTPAPVSEQASDQALTQAIQTAGLNGLLTWSSAQPAATPAGLWIPIHSAVILSLDHPLNPQLLQSALQQSLRGNLTTATLGIDFRPEAAANGTIYALTGPKPLWIATLTTPTPDSPTPVNLCLFANDRTVLQSLLDQAHAQSQSEHRQAPTLHTRRAAFNHTSQRGPYARLTTLVDGTNQRPPNAPNATPPYFSGNLRSLSDAFAALTSESFEEHQDGSILRQSVIYQWQPQ